MDVGRFEHQLLLGEGRSREILRERAERREGAETEHSAAIHGYPPSMGAVTSALPFGRAGVDPAAGPC